MKNQIIKYAYEGQEVEFDISNTKLMVNATEMANVFGKKVNDFLRLDQTKAFIQECLSYGKSRSSEEEENGISHFLGIEKEEDLVRVNYRHGTWMHRILALKFAAWISPRFELWVYLTIDQILSGQGPVKPEVTEELKEVLTAMDESNERIRAAQERIRLRNEEDQRIIEEETNKVATYQRRVGKLNKVAANQLVLFVSRSDN